jgi:hypothetical protein
VEYNRQQFQDYNNARSPHAVIVDPLIADRVYHISKFGILRSDDGGLHGSLFSSQRLPEKWM